MTTLKHPLLHFQVFVVSCKMDCEGEAPLVWIDGSFGKVGAETNAGSAVQPGVVQLQYKSNAAFRVHGIS